MKEYKNLTLIGTSHIAIQSVNEVEKSIFTLLPDIITLELDPSRYNALLSKGKRIPRISDVLSMGLKGFLFNLIGSWVENRLGKLVGVKPGAEMKKAIRTAEKVGAQIFLIDQDIRITLKNISKRITWKEKLSFLKDLFSGLVLRKKAYVEFDLEKVPSEKVIRELTQQLKEMYPSLYLSLIQERNEHMAKNLYKIITTYPHKRILAIVGAGHENEILKMIQEMNNDQIYAS